jgi:hypothetical protein
MPNQIIFLLGYFQVYQRILRFKLDQEVGWQNGCNCFEYPGTIDADYTGEVDYFN